MKSIVVALVLLTGLAGVAQADIWKWVDAGGKIHFVDTKTPIYTWTDEQGFVHYSDTPGHEGAVSVELIWVSPGTLENPTGAPKDSQAGNGTNGDSESGGYAFPGETPSQRAEREKAEEYYCKRATEVYDSYLKAPKLYTTSESGEPEYLSDKDAKKLISDTAARVDEYCN